MTFEQRKKLKLALSLTGSLIVFLFFIIFINTLTRHYSDETIRVATKNVLEQWSGQDVHITKKNRSTGSGLSFSRTFTAKIGNKNARIYIVTITGRSGPYSTVFCMPDSGLVEFCGFLLHPGRVAPTIQLGITPRMLENWKRKISTLAQRPGANNEK